MSSYKVFKLYPFNHFMRTPLFGNGKLEQVRYFSPDNLLLIPNKPH